MWVFNWEDAHSRRRSVSSPSLGFVFQPRLSPLNSWKEPTPGELSLCPGSALLYILFHEEASRSMTGISSLCPLMCTPSTPAVCTPAPVHPSTRAHYETSSPAWPRPTSKSAGPLPFAREGACGCHPSSLIPPFCRTITETCHWPHRVIASSTVSPVTLLPWEMYGSGVKTEKTPQGAPESSTRPCGQWQ